MKNYRVSPLLINSQNRQYLDSIKYNLFQILQLVKSRNSKLKIESVKISYKNILSHFLPFALWLADDFVLSPFLVLHKYMLQCLTC